jgi:S-adenosylmethionine:tRNA ribosyltransferase-isomerase
VEPEIKIEDYNYILPEQKIAKFPVDLRDHSRILIFRDNNISDTKFLNLDELLPESSLMVFNNTKVVPARLIFKKITGAHIEIFCLEPYSPSEYNRSFSAHNSCSWVAVVGNIKRWKEGVVKFDSVGHQDLDNIDLTAVIEGKIDDKYIIKFNWKGDFAFSQVMEMCGKVPIPPYLRRETEESDKERYQTLYAKERGSVAAPTAGLHFTDYVLNRIDEKGIERAEVCLHVGAGTFIPVKSKYVADHRMHSEPFTISFNLIAKILDAHLNKRNIISVGTTSVRTLESLYYLGIQCINNGFPGDISQWEPYEGSYNISVAQSLEALINWMKKENMSILERRTQIIIVPGFKFKLCNILITNFHQPQSTLLLLISAFVGNYWKEIYNYALNNDFRFLSYGDSSILFRPDIHIDI